MLVIASWWIPYGTSMTSFQYFFTTLNQIVWDVEG